jgi:hypothetical protein
MADGTSIGVKSLISCVAVECVKLYADTSLARWLKATIKYSFFGM